MAGALSDWINGSHLTEEALDAAARRYREDPYETVWLDDFLLPHRLDGLRELYRQDGDFAPSYGIYGEDGGARSAVDEATYLATPAHRRFEKEYVLRGAKPGHEMGRGCLLHMMFLRFCAQPTFQAFLWRLTGVNPGGIHSHQVRIMAPGHHVGRHQDVAPGRQLTMVFYPGDSWTPDENGCLVQFRADGRSRRIEPHPNRVVLFRISAHSSHAVEPVVDTSRWGYTVWMGRNEQPRLP